MPPPTTRSLRARKHELLQKTLLNEAFKASVRPTTASIHLRVHLLLEARSKTAQVVAEMLGVSPVAFSRWLSGKTTSAQLPPRRVASTLSGPLLAPESWIETGTFAQGAPEGGFMFAAFLTWIDALTAVAAVQLYSALTIKLAPHPFFAVLDDVALHDIRPVTAPYPGKLDRQHRDSWAELMQRVPFLPPDAQSSLLTHWGVLEQVEANPCQLIGIEQESIIHMACAWAVSWAQKITGMGETSPANNKLARDILGRRLQPRRHGVPGPYFPKLGIAVPG